MGRCTPPSLRISPPGRSGRGRPPTVGTGNDPEWAHEPDGEARNSIRLGTLSVAGSSALAAHPAAFTRRCRSCRPVPMALPLGCPVLTAPAAPPLDERLGASVTLLLAAAAMSARWFTRPMQTVERLQITADDLLPDPAHARSKQLGSRIRPVINQSPLTVDWTPPTMGAVGRPSPV